MTNLDSILKSRDITLSTKVHLVRAMVFSVVMYGCESWTVKKVEHGRIDAFELWCWKDSWESLGLQEYQTSQSKRKSTLNINWKDWCWSWNSNTLSTWYEELTHWERPWCWERLSVGGEGDDRGWDGWMASLTLGVGDGQGGLVCCHSWGHKQSDTTEWLNWICVLGTRLGNAHINIYDTQSLLSKNWPWGIIITTVCIYWVLTMN